jgi:hypothetical protein
VSKQGQKQYPAVIETVRYASTDLKCPLCRQWRASLNIYADGALRCHPCPVYARLCRPRKQVAA